MSSMLMTDERLVIIPHHLVIADMLAAATHHVFSISPCVSDTYSYRSLNQTWPSALPPAPAQPIPHLYHQYPEMKMRLSKLGFTFWVVIKNYLLLVTYINIYILCGELSFWVICSSVWIISKLKIKIFL